MKGQGERAQTLGGAKASDSFLADNDVGLVVRDQPFPAVLMLMSQAVDFLRIGGREMTSDPLPAEKILARMALHIGCDCLVLSVDAQLLPAGLLNQLAHIPEPDREVLHQSHRISSLPFVVSFFRPPFDKSGPARQRRQLERQVVLPELCGNGQGVKALE